MGINSIVPIPVDLSLMKEELTNDEGRVYKVYEDQFGNKTIGIGHLLPPSTDANLTWTDETIDSVYEEDLQNAYKLIYHQPWFNSLDTDSRRRALINMSFNLGSKLLKFFSFLKFIQKQNWELACEDLRKTAWYEEVKPRAERIIKQIMSG